MWLSPCGGASAADRPKAKADSAVPGRLWLTLEDTTFSLYIYFPDDQKYLRDRGLVASVEKLKTLKLKILTKESPIDLARMTYLPTELGKNDRKNDISSFLQIKKSIS